MFTSTRTPLRSRRLIGAAAALSALMVMVPSPAAAIQSENGYRDCGVYVAALQARYRYGLARTPPGGYTTNHYSSAWATKTRNGSYRGNWVASADYLDFDRTYSFCRDYG